MNPVVLNHGARRPSYQLGGNEVLASIYYDFVMDMDGFLEVYKMHRRLASWNWNNCVDTTYMLEVVSAIPGHVVLGG